MRAKAQSPSPSPLPVDDPPPLDFRAHYDAEFNHVWHSLRRFGVHERDLEDLCHETFIVFYRTLNEFDARRPVRPWLSGIAFRVASDYRRRAQHRREVPSEQPAVASAEPPADERLAERDKQRLVLAALDMLDDARRAVLVMHDFDDQAMPEIAAALKLPLNTAYSRLRLARADFAEAVRRLQATTPGSRHGR
jgi:RNA polymerase sigma-70 factor (ECF subfamily)